MGDGLAMGWEWVALSGDEFVMDGGELRLVATGDRLGVGDGLVMGNNE